jgi:hypothetical protein
MFRNLRLTCAAALLASALLPSLAGSEVLHSKLKGPSLYASFNDFDPVSCVFTMASFSINEMQTVDASGAAFSGPLLSLYIDQYSLCGGHGGAEYFAQELLPDGALHTDSARMSSASLQVTIYASYERGQPKIVPINIDLVWTGDGDVSTGHTSRITSNRFFRTMTRSHGTTRRATVSGTMLLWGENVADTDSFALLGYSHSGSITVQKPR